MMIFINLIQNIALLIALATIYQVLGIRLRRFSIRQQVLTGLLFGGVGVFVMMTPLNLMPGIIFDGRSIILSVSGLYGGLVAAAISVVLCAGYRLYVGGDGMVVGVAIIFSSALIGLLFRYFFHRKPGMKNILSFIVFGLLVHFFVLLFMLALPQEKGITVIKQVGWAVILLYTPATTLICLLFEDYENKFLAQRELQINEKRFRLLAENARDIIYRYELIPRRGLTFISASVYDSTGYKPEEMYQGEDFWVKLIHADDRHIIQSFAGENIRLDEPLTLRCLAKDGSIVWTEYRNTPVYDQKGRLVAVEGIIRDITESRAVEAALRMSEEKYRLIAKNISDVILVMDIDLRFTYASPSIKLFLGLDEDEMIGQDLESILVPQSYRLVADSLRHDIERVHSGDQAVKRIYQIQAYRQDRSTVWVEASFSYIDRAAHRDESIVAVLRDITDRKKAEEDLRQVHELMRYIIEHNRGGIAVLDESLNFIYVSQQYLEDFRVKELDLIGKNIRDVFPHLSDYWQDQLNAALAGDIAGALEDPYEHIDGSIDWVRWECRPWYQVSGTIGGIIFYTEIVSDRKQAQEALQQSHVMVIKLTDQVPGMVYQYQTFPDGTAAILYASSGVYDLYEVTPEEVMENAGVIFDLIHPADIDRVNREIRLSAESLQYFHAEFRVILPEKGVCWRLCDAKPERLSDGSVLWHGIVTDITGRKQTEQKINEQIAELRRWNVAMLGREKRNLELKQEVNILLDTLGEAPRYTHSGVQSSIQTVDNNIQVDEKMSEFGRKKIEEP